MEIKESVVAITGIVGFSVVALVIATMKLEPARARIGSGDGNVLFQQEQESEAGAPLLDCPTVEDADLLKSSNLSPASDASLHLSPAATEPNQEGTGQPSVVAGFFTSPDYAPSRERFLDMSYAIYRALDLTVKEMRDVDASFWEENPYAYLLNQKPGETLRDYFQIEDPRLALERLWTEPGTEALWRTHMQLFKQQHMGHVTGADLGLTQKRLFEIRDAIWSGVSPAHQFLFRLDQETR